MPLIFTYGKTGCHNIGGSLVSKANTFPHYRMYDYYGYPVLKKDKAGTAIHGELWFVHSLNDQDKLESKLYKRELIFLENPCVFAYTYLFDQSVEDLADYGS